MEVFKLFDKRKLKIEMQRDVLTPTFREVRFKSGLRLNFLQIL